MKLSEGDKSDLVLALFLAGMIGIVVFFTLWFR